LLLRFFNNASKLLTDPNDNEILQDENIRNLNRVGEIHVPLKSGLPYDNWNIKLLSRHASLRSKFTIPFNFSWFPLYEHRRTIGFKGGLSKSNNKEIVDKSPKLFSFITMNNVVQPKKLRNLSNSSDSSDEDN